MILRVLFIFGNDLLESRDEEVDQENEDNEEENKHRQGRDPGPVCTAAGIICNISTGCKIEKTSYNVCLQLRECDTLSINRL